MDSQSVKNTDTAEQKGYDAGKKVSGIKRHIAVDTQGLPHAIQVTTADVTDRAGALAMFDENRSDLNRVQNVLVDGGYTGKPFAAAVMLACVWVSSSRRWALPVGPTWHCVWVSSGRHEWPGVVITGMPLTGLAGVFVYGSKARRDERMQYAAQDPAAQSDGGA